MWPAERRYDDAIFGAARRHGVPIAALLATAGIESSFEPHALNPDDPGGAWGMFQMIPATARGLGFQGAMLQLQEDVGLAADLAAKLWKENLARSRGDVLGAASAYNGGWRPAMGFGQMVDGKFRNQEYVNRFYRAYTYFIDQVKGGDAALASSFRPPLGDRVSARLASTKVPWVAVILGAVALLGYVAFRLGAP
jgi:hypothetical protein